MTNRTTARWAAGVLFVFGVAAAPLVNQDSGSRIETDVPADAPYPAPRFEISHRDAQLVLTGHTLSVQHERNLIQVAKISFPEHEIQAQFDPLGTVPAYWHDTTAQIVYLLAESAFATASLVGNDLTVRSITPNKLGWQSRFSALLATLPTEIQVDAEFLAVDPELSATDICKRMLATFESGPINFEESSDRFRSSALPRLDRVVAIAKACPRATLSIIGHTDASGSAALNQQLSEKRARVVGDYLAVGGIERGRFQIVGAGSSKPVADDESRYGRSLNRRIEISFELSE